MVERITPQQYFQNTDDQPTLLIKGIVIGATIIAIGLVLGASIVYICKK